MLKLLAVSLESCNFTKNELLHTYFLRILARFKLLFIVYRIPGTFIFPSTFHLLLLLVLVITHTLVYAISYKNAFHSYCSFLLIFTLFIQPCLIFIQPFFIYTTYLYNHRLTELNVSLFYLIKLIFFKNM